MNGVLPRSAAFCLALACLLLLPACGSDDAASSADIDDSCIGHPFAPVVPNTPEIASKPLVWRDCRPAEVTACYSNAPDCSRGSDRCLITLHDAAYGVSPTVAQDPDIGMHDHAQSMILAMSKTNVDMVVGTRDNLLQFPELLDQIGGPPRLPVVDTVSTGDTYVIPIHGRQDNPRRGELRSVIADRYVLIIECAEPLRDNTHARRVYEPFLGELDLAKLP